MIAQILWYSTVRCSHLKLYIFSVKKRFTCYNSNHTNFQDLPWVWPPASSCRWRFRLGSVSPKEREIPTSKVYPVDIGLGWFQPNQPREPHHSSHPSTGTGITWKIRQGFFWGGQSFLCRQKIWRKTHGTWSSRWFQPIWKILVKLDHFPQ